MSQSDSEKKTDIPYVINLTVAGMVGQVGCVTLGVIFAALFLGLWLDKTFETRPTFTILLMVGSIPVTIYLLFRLAKAAADRIVTDKSKNVENPEEDVHIGNRP